MTLKLHQIQHTVNGTVPSDTSNCSVFEQPGVVRLTHRIKELEHEKALQKKQMRSGADSTGGVGGGSNSGGPASDMRRAVAGRGRLCASLQDFTAAQEL